MPPPIHTKNITNNIALQMIIEVPHTYVHKMEQTTTTLTMINLAQQIFLFSGLPVDFFVPLQSFFLSSLVNMYTKILISQQQERSGESLQKVGY